MKHLKKYFYYAIAVALLILSFVVFMFFNQRNEYLTNVTEVNKTSEWKKHIIDTNLKYYGMAGMDTADLNGDGRLDLLFHESARNNPQPYDGIYWYEISDNPKTSPWIRHRISDPAYPIRWGMAIATGDVDNDGDVDVVSLSFDNSYVYLCLNPSRQGNDVNKPWNTLMIEGSGGIRRDGERMELTDIDKDGYLDVVFPRGLRSIRKVYVLFNPYGIPTNPWMKKEIGSIAGTDAHDIYTADIDNDGDLDIINASGDGAPLGSGKIYWYEHPDGNPRGGAWIRHPVETRSVCWGGLKIADVNGDGWTDVIAAEAHNLPGNIYWFENPKSNYGSDWKRYTIGSQTFPHVCTWIDVEGDGVDELWVPDCSFFKHGTFKGGLVYFKIGADATKPWSKYRIANAPEVGRPVLTMDVDGDGDSDIISGADLGSVSASLVWWENNSKR